MRKIASILFLAAALGLTVNAQTESQSSGHVSEVGAMVPQPVTVQGAHVSYVESDRKWRFGFRSEPYDKISEHLQEKLADALEHRGIRPLPVLGTSSCCAVVLELLEVTTRPAMIKKPGMDVSATVTILDSSRRPIYAKGFRGESKTVINTYGHLIDHAIDNMVENIVADDNVIKALVEGKL